MDQRRGQVDLSVFLHYVAEIRQLLLLVIRERLDKPNPTQ